MISNIKASSILSSLKNGPDKYFGIKYNMNLYRGCQHQCIYCDSRSECYRIENFADILIKENAPELLTKELRSKRNKGTIGTGSMNDPYMPIEEKTGITRTALQIINTYRFPVHIITKSNLVTRDIDILKQLSKIYAAVSFSITTINDELSRKLEPAASSSTERFAAIKKLSSEGIYTGVLISPVLPFITDTKENITELIMKSKEAGAKYIIAWMGMTNRTGQREYYYDKLEKHFPGVKEKYIKTYGEDYSCPVPQHKELQNLYYTLCKKHNIPMKMKFYSENIPEQISMF